MSLKSTLGVNNTSFLPSLTQNLISNFELRLKDDTFKRWYFYFSDSAGPSVSEGINDVVKKIQKWYKIRFFIKKLPILWNIAEYYMKKKYHPNSIFLYKYKNDLY